MSQEFCTGIFAIKDVNLYFNFFKIRKKTLDRVQRSLYIKSYI